MSEEQRCKNCKHWSTEVSRDDRVAASGLRLCECPQIVNMVYVEYEIDDDTGERLPVDFADDAAAYNDGSDYLAEFSTGPEFGCVHWEAKD